jgi:hypothetical protein
VVGELAEPRTAEAIFDIRNRRGVSAPARSVALAWAMRLGPGQRRLAYSDPPNQPLTLPLPNFFRADIALSSATETKEKRTTA